MDGAILLADPKSKAWDFATKIQDYIRRERGADVPLEEVVIDHFRNGELNIVVPENVRKREAFFIQDSTLNPQEWWVQLLLLKDLLLSSSASTVSYVLPNMLFSRKDRKEKPHVPISARALAESISPGLQRIITMDLHASQIQGFYPSHLPLDNLYSAPQLVQYLQNNPLKDLKNTVILSPDAGGVSRAEKFAKRLGSPHPIALIDKRRVKEGEVEKMRLVGHVRRKDVLIIDDIIDSGNTLIEAAKVLKDHGAQTLYCYGTHGIFTKGTQELKSVFGRVITSNTHYQEENTVEVVDTSSVFAEAIYRAQKGESISKLFE